jgi:hypothetical protein
MPPSRQPVSKGSRINSRSRQLPRIRSRRTSTNLAAPSPHAHATRPRWQVTTADAAGAGRYLVADQVAAVVGKTRRAIDKAALSSFDPLLSPSSSTPRLQWPPHAQRLVVLRTIRTGSYGGTHPRQDRGLQTQMQSMGRSSETTSLTSRLLH